MKGALVFFALGSAVACCAEFDIGFLPTAPRASVSFEGVTQEGRRGFHCPNSPTTILVHQGACGSSRIWSTP